MKTSIETLQPILRSLRMGGMAESLPMRITLARKGENRSSTVSVRTGGRRDEPPRRTTSKTAIGRSKDPSMKTLEDFDWTFNPRVPRRLIQELSSGQFVHENGTCYLSDLPAWGKPICVAPWPSQPSQPDGKRFGKTPSIWPTIWCAQEKPTDGAN
ncbi:MAG: hypothetical protein IPN71_17585 [Fibrobacteres bacterium]|nr:hypothetical protein [Fibrobacterota bacterium]